MDRSRFIGLLSVAIMTAVVSVVLAWPGSEPASAAGAASVDAGAYHTCAVSVEGGIRCWGGNGLGQLGDGTNVARPLPVYVEGLESGMTAVSAGGYHTCALTEAGGVKCWGENLYGALGDGSAAGYSNVPVGVFGLQSGALSVSAGMHHSCAVTSSGGVKCWGDNFYGELGDGTFANSNTPVDVVGLQSGVVSVAAGNAKACALTVSGGVLCWGDGYGKLPRPVSWLASGVADISVGGGVCAATTDGGLKCGSVQMETGVVDVAVGHFHACAVTSDGGVKCWGWNEHGQLGDGTTARRDFPVDVVGLDGDAVAIAANAWHTCALMAAGNIQCWGWNLSGQIGDGTVGSDNPTPVDVLELKPGSCPPEGCSTPPPPGIPLPDCPDLAPESGDPGMTLTGPATVLVGDPFTVCVNADPEPEVGIAGYQTEVEFPEGLQWVQRPACASAVGSGEVQSTLGGSLPALCIRGFGPADEARHIVDGSGIIPPPHEPLDTPLGRLVEVDAVCGEPGTYTMVLAAAQDDAYGAIYFDATTLAWVHVATFQHEGRDVADIHTVTCIAPDAQQDTDGDGCTDANELLYDPEAGGYRDPNNFWDFYDTPTGPGLIRDGAVSGRDFFAVLRHFNSVGDAGEDPLSTPPETGYHPAYDRGDLVGPNAWNVGAADGSIAATDFFAVLAQFNHECP